MIALDTNFLIYAHRADSPWHPQARQAMQRLLESGRPWSIPWPCLHEFFGIVTHPRIFKPPTPPEPAIHQLDAWLEAPAFVPLCESEGYWPILRKTLAEGKVSGPRVHDARIAAICLLHAVDEFWTADRDFSRFPGLPVRNPLLP